MDDPFCGSDQMMLPESLRIGQGPSAPQTEALRATVRAATVSDSSPFRVRLQVASDLHTHGWRTYSRSYLPPRPPACDSRGPSVASPQSAPTSAAQRGCHQALVVAGEPGPASVLGRREPRLDRCRVRWPSCQESDKYLIKLKQIPFYIF